MAFNPSKGQESLDNPNLRQNDVNDPQFKNHEGYYPYELFHQEIITPLFGEVTPSMHIDTIPGDRFVMTENSKTVLNQVAGNFLSTINQYVDTYFVPLRSVYPQNYEKFIVNPVKGQDLPNSALPQVPLFAMIFDMLQGNHEVDFETVIGSSTMTVSGLFNSFGFEEETDDDGWLYNMYVLNKLYLISTILSRGQLLDYLGAQFDVGSPGLLNSSPYNLGVLIDNFHRALYGVFANYGEVHYFEPSLDSNIFTLVDAPADRQGYLPYSTLSEYRDCMSDILEKGAYFVFEQPLVYSYLNFEDLNTAAVELFQALYTYTLPYRIDDVSAKIDLVNTSAEPFDGGCISLVKPLAYQQVIAQFFTNDRVDNIFSAELFMQLLRAVMYPSVGGFSSEPTFSYNGVTTEYDYISYGGFAHSLISGRVPGVINRQHVFSTLMFLKRRSLRYGDYFTASRVNMLAVNDDLWINVVDGKVSPVETTQNLLMQRFLNAGNYIGQGFLPYFASMHGVTPSDTGTKPRYIAHRKTVIDNQITNNTGDNQGAQTTNFVALSNKNGFDVFIDDYGVILNLVSFDVMPVYTSGIDATFRLSDRFDYFNPMLQNIGDQSIRVSEIFGDPRLTNEVFGYTMRNGEYKQKVSRAHGAASRLLPGENGMPGTIMTYPLDRYETVHISPEFIRDKPIYLDNVISKMTGISPGEYFHFVISCENQVQAARKMQIAPPVLF